VLKTLFAAGICIQRTAVSSHVVNTILVLCTQQCTETGVQQGSLPSGNQMYAPEEVL